jgi:lipopolysaccharide transport system permease protein
MPTLATATPDTPSHAIEVFIAPGRAEGNYWRDLWRYRELFYFLAWRDILVRYKQTSIGIVWAVIRPFLTMVVFTVVFNKVARLPAPGDAPYPLLVYAGLLPWQFFSTALSDASGSLIGSANLVSKVYFPRIIVPSGAVIASLVDLTITCVLMAGMMAWYGYAPDWRIVFVPLAAMLAFFCAIGAGIWLAAVNVRYRDFRYIVPFIVQFGTYVSPVGFSSSNVPEQWRMLYALNPMVGVIDAFRWALLRGESPIWWPALAVSIAMTALFLAVGVWYFRKTERSFADVI